ncbi:MAG: hypothetical protein JNM72_21295 [Deltaproteobacteria bacterium]|nr:hypothetical protein [Deltaproteobacteria bacterium]
MSTPRPAASTAPPPVDGPLRDAQSSALEKLGEHLRDLDPGPRARPRSFADGQRLIADAEARLQLAARQLEEREAKRAKLEGQLQRLDSARPGLKATEVQAVLDQAQVLDGKLLEAGTLKTRLDEGLRSLRPKVHKLISEKLQPVIAARGDQMVASVDPAGQKGLEAELPEWVTRWEEYVRLNLDHDLANLTEDLWQRLDKEPLVLPPPTLPPLPVVQLKYDLQLPTVNVERDAVEMGSGMLRHGRSLIYGLMSVAGLAGLRGSGGGAAEAGDRLLFGLGAVLMMVGAAAFGAYQTRRDRAREERRLNEQARERAERAVRDAVNHWLDRCKDRFQLQFTTRMRDQRLVLRRWVEAEVRPTLQRVRQQSDDLERQKAEAKAGLDKLREARDVPDTKQVERLRATLQAAREQLALGPAPADGR